MTRSKEPEKLPHNGVLVFSLAIRNGPIPLVEALPTCCARSYTACVLRDAGAVRPRLQPR